MAKPGGNRTRYFRNGVEQSLDNPKVCTEEFLEKEWRRRVARSPVKTPYETFDAVSLSGEATAVALELLSRMTGDEAFRTALLGLRAYELDKGGLKENLKRLFRGKLHARPAVRYAMPSMERWRAFVQSDIQAARLAAAQRGVPGQSFAAVVDELRKAFVDWKLASVANEPEDALPTGDTGRKLKVRMAYRWTGRDNQPVREPHGVMFNADGFALVPDSATWRRMIHRGMFWLCGVIEQAEEAGKTLSKIPRDSLLGA